MNDLTFEFPATTEPRRALAVRVGNVGSGDLEILCQGGPAGRALVHVRTSVDGFDTVWRNVLQRFFLRHQLAGTFEINDQGATPGVVALRLLQVLDAARSHHIDDDLHTPKDRT